MLVKLLSYNIKVGAETSLMEVARATASIGADIVALQEVGCRWLWGDKGDGVQTISLGAKLPYTRFAPALASFTGGAFGVALLSKYPITTHKIRYLERHVDEPRVLLQAEIALPEDDLQARERAALALSPGKSPTGGKSLRVLTTHLSYKEDRVWQSRQIAQTLAEKGPPAVLLGDLNSEPDENLHTLAAPGFIDAFLQCGEGPGFTFATNDPKWRIDYAMVDPRCQIVSCKVLDIKASDHYPLLLELEI